MAAHCYSPTRWSKGRGASHAQPAGGRTVHQAPENGRHSNSKSLAIRHVPQRGVGRRSRAVSRSIPPARRY